MTKILRTLRAEMMSSRQLRLVRNQWVNHSIITMIVDGCWSCPDTVRVQLEQRRCCWSASGRSLVGSHAGAWALGGGSWRGLGNSNPGLRLSLARDAEALRLVVVGANAPSQRFTIRARFRISKPSKLENCQ